VRLGLARLGRLQSEVMLGWLGWAPRKMEKGEGKEEAGWAGLRFELGFGPVANLELGKSFSFSNVFIICKLI
jgi:hypothetical protein